MPIGKKRPLFKPRARIVGSLDWTCVYCGRVTTTKLSPFVFRLQCKHRECRRKFLYGIKFFEMPGGGQLLIPNDLIVCDENELLEAFQRGLDELIESFPEAFFVKKRYKANEPVHELVSEVDEECS